jgi:large conductance mechanosensitive channel
MSLVSEFKAFLLRGNVVDLAVGVVIGAAFSKIVDAVVNGLFMPVIGIVSGGIDFSGFAPKLMGTPIPVGNVIQAIFNFVIVGACLFLVVKAMNKLQPKKPDGPPEPTTSEKLLMEIRDSLKK